VGSPYRQRPDAPPVEAPSRDGTVRLVREVDRIALDLGGRRLVVAGDGAAWLRRDRRPGRGRALPLERARLWLARAHPTRDLSVWYEGEPGVVQRLGGVRPLPLLDADALRALRALDRLTAAAREGLAAWAGGAEDAIELGRGGHRLLLVRFRDRLVVHTRPVFRERPRRALEVCAGGGLVIAARGGDRRARFHSRFGVSVSGNRVQFVDQEGATVASLLLPWIEPEDREALAARCGEAGFPASAEERRRAEEADSQPRAPLGPWYSGLGRTPPLAALLPAPLPYSAAWRLRR